MTPIVNIGLGSDWHIGASTDKQILKCLSALKKQNPDILCLLGDFNGGRHGAKAVRGVIKLTRKVFPNMPIIACLGNHDLWVRGRPARYVADDYGSTALHGRPSLRDWHANYLEIIEIFREFKIHFLDEDGPWRSADYTGLVLFGNTLWYDSKSPPTNDALYMPHCVEGDTNAHLYRRSIKSIEGQIDQLTPEDTTRVFCSHFPVLYPGGRCRGDIDYGGPEWIGKMLMESLGVKYFLNGHAHQSWSGPERFECGSDYGSPKAIIVPVHADQPECKSDKELADKPE
jgi:hypothetical protein